MASSTVRLDLTLPKVYVIDTVRLEFTRLKLAGASTQTLRQYMNSVGPCLPDYKGDCRPGLYNDDVVTQYISDLGI